MLESVDNANADNGLRYDPSPGGVTFDLATGGLSTKMWNLSFNAGTDPAVHTMGFEVKYGE